MTNTTGRAGLPRRMCRTILAAAMLPAAITAAAVTGPAGAAATSAARPASQAAPAAPPASSASVPARACRMVRIPVALAPDLPRNQVVAGEYCTPAGQKPGTVDVLVPGATYNLRYWDWPQDPSLYSYVDRTLAADRATLAIDRLGTGSSSKPPATDLTVSVSAYVLHEVIDWIRAATGHPEVDLIGHSLGSVIAEYEAGQWPDSVNRLVLTGLLNEFTSNWSVMVTAFEPVLSNPEYVTTTPGMRSYLFYVPGTSDPAVVAYDEAHKDAVSITELYTAYHTIVPVPTDRVTAPVELVVGQDDREFCKGVDELDCSDPSQVLAYERQWFTHAASVSYAVVPGTGHDLALSTTAGESFAMVNAWLTRR